jgi:hypothetical protein
MTDGLSRNGRTLAANCRRTGYANASSERAFISVSPKRIASFFRLCIQVPAWLHALVEHSNYLHQARANNPVK